MRPDIEGKSLVKLHAIGMRRISHPNGTVTEAGDYTAFKAKDIATGEDRFFLSLLPGDLSVDWLEITETRDQFILSVSGGNLFSDRKA